MTRPKRTDTPLPGMGGSGVARVRRGFDQQLTAQRAMGHLETVDAGLIALGRTLADAVDAEHTDPNGSRFTVGHLAGRLQSVMLELRGERRDPAGDGIDEELARLAAAIRDRPRP